MCKHSTCADYFKFKQKENTDVEQKVAALPQLS